MKKCHVMQFGRNNNNEFNYTMYDSHGVYSLEYSNEERDIGVIISNDLKFASHINLITAKANRMLGLILNCFLSNQKSTRAKKLMLRRTAKEAKSNATR